MTNETKKPIKGLLGIFLTRKSRCSQCGLKFTMAACGPSHVAVQAEIERAWWQGGKPRIVTDRERRLWLDGWGDGFLEGVKKGKRLERDAARKRIKARAQNGETK